MMVKIDYISDVLCVWAWAAEARNEELMSNFDGQVELIPKFINLFGSTEARIGQGWKEKGGFEGFAKHTIEVVDKFPELALNPRVWSEVRPTSSMTAHLYLKAAQLSGADNRQILQLASSLRHAFFVEAKDISCRKEISAVFVAQGIDISELFPFLEDGSAYASLWEDQLLREAQQIKGSPSYLLDGGRQTLFGNVGYRVIEANVNELLNPGSKEGASWC
ncbi:DsbA family oxidoreductase [Vibrio parahaemolyticus]|uniref:DsbA family oxidoreductase n=1 Tax=Vibrio mediterranei TaxID=689 RepID=UPI004068A745